MMPLSTILAIPRGFRPSGILGLIGVVLAGYLMMG